MHLLAETSETILALKLSADDIKDFQVFVHGLEASAKIGYVLLPLLGGVN